ncbi:MAG: hypothetical protein K2Q10_04175, partial [Rhodospirillales bacterium]|nr:hypothetical protein [Rhodospirillales bacterium]
MASPSSPSPLALIIRGCSQDLWVAFTISFFVNLLMLVAPVYMMQIYDRVLTSHSIETLIWLTVIALGLFAVMGGLYILRSWLSSRVSRKVDVLLASRLLTAQIQRGERGGGSESQGLRDLNTVKSFISSPTMDMLFDLPWLPLFLLVIFLLDPWMGVLAVVGSVISMGLAVANQKTTKADAEASLRASMRSYAEASA